VEFGDGVEAALGPGMAACEAAEREPRSAREAEAGDGERGVLRAGGQVDAAAGADGVQHRGYEELVRAESEGGGALARAGWGGHEPACGGGVCGDDADLAEAGRGAWLADF